MMNTPDIKRICIIGVGLIGGSLARACKKNLPDITIIGAGKNSARLEIAQQLGVVDQISTDFAAAVKDVDLVVLAVPVGAMQGVLSEIADAISPDTIITDVGSTKGSVMKAAEQVFTTLPANFVPGHPIAGTEDTGVEASVADLYQNRRVILTPHATTHPHAVQQVRALWQACGAEVIEMDAVHHDEVLAATSHLPHMLAYTLVDTLARMHDKREIFRYAAGGFRDFTRIASSAPEMWRDICLANQDALVEVLKLFQKDLQTLITAIDKGDEAVISDIFTRAKQARDQFCETEEPEPDTAGI